MSRIEIELSTGRKIRLAALDQSLVYEGLLEGLPTKEGNQRHLSYLMSRWPEYETVLIPPVEEVLDWDEPRPYPFGTPASLPSVACAGRFRSAPIGEDSPLYYSELVIVWLQKSFALPVDPTEEAKIRELDWDAIARNEEY